MVHAAHPAVERAEYAVVHASDHAHDQHSPRISDLWRRSARRRRSWQLKKMQRAVEEAQDSGRSLEEVCLERFSDLELLPELQRMAATGSKGERRGGAHLLSHLQ